MLMFFGIVFSILHGAGFPILSVVFGNMTNAFLRAEVSNMTVAAYDEDAYSYSPSPTTTEPLYLYRANNGTGTAENPTPLPPIGVDEFIDNVVMFAVYYSIIGVGMLLTSYAQVRR